MKNPKQYAEIQLRYVIEKKLSLKRGTGNRGMETGNGNWDSVRINRGMCLERQGNLLGKTGEYAWKDRAICGE